MNMTPSEYLDEILKQQTLADDGGELAELRSKRGEVEGLLKTEFPSSKVTIRYGGSKAKNTMIKENYDLDVVCYFDEDETAAGSSLEEIYRNVRNALQKKYSVTEKTSALRLFSAEKVDFHIDVVPGRFTDGSRGDVYIFQKNAEKCRLKTNLDTHITHIRDSGLTKGVRLLKLWSARNGIRVKTFVLELMVIDLLGGYKKSSLETQFVHVLTEFRDNIDDISVSDPANSYGNDLTPALDSVRALLSAVARSTLGWIESDNWEQVFGKVEKAKSFRRAAFATAAVAATPAAAKPWGK